MNQPNQPISVVTRSQRFYHANAIPFSESRAAANSPIMFPVGERNVAWIGRDDKPNLISDHKCLVRLSPDSSHAIPLAVVKRSYAMIHNRELFNAVSDTMEAAFTADELDDAYCVDRVAMQGKSCLREYIFPSINCRIGGRGDRASLVALRIIVQNGYGGSALRNYTGAIDFFCTNGMIRGEYATMYRRHTSGLVIPQLREHIDKAIAAYADSALAFTRWADTPVTREDTMAFFHAVAKTPSRFEHLSNQWLNEIEVRGRTLWSVYSALTYYASHVDETKKAPADSDAINGIVHRRELDVAKWIQTDEWKKLETV